MSKKKKEKDMTFKAKITLILDISSSQLQK